MAAVLVHIDLDASAGTSDGATTAVHPSSLAALAAARTLASAWGATLYAAAVVEAVRATPLTPALRLELGRAGADRAVIATTTHPVSPLWADQGTAWQMVLDQLRPRVVMFGADAPSAAELAPRTGSRLGARLVTRARVSGGDLVELRDPDGGFVRASESGAAVALISGVAQTTRGYRAATDVSAASAAAPEPARNTSRGMAVATLSAGSEHAIEVAVLATTGAADARITITGTAPADPASSRGVIIALGPDADGADVRVAVDALAARLGAHVLPASQLDEASALAPELCIAVGRRAGDLAGCASLVRIGVDPADRKKGDDGALPAPIATALADLARVIDEVLP